MKAGRLKLISGSRIIKKAYYFDEAHFKSIIDVWKKREDITKLFIHAIPHVNNENKTNRREPK